jgi:hypothetical protein
LKNIFGVSWDFHKSAEKFSKFFAPLYPLEWTCGPQNIKIIENGPQIKKSGHPWSIRSIFQLLTASNVIFFCFQRVPSKWQLTWNGWTFRLRLWCSKKTLEISW